MKWLEDKIVLIFFLLTTIGFASVSYIFIYIKKNVNKGGTLGPLGDFFGGFANPTLAFLTIVGLLLTLYMQQKMNRASEAELAEAKKQTHAEALERQKRDFESTFFQLLNFHDSIVNGLRITSQSTEHKGRSCFKYYYEELYQLCRYYYVNGDACKAFDDAYVEFWRRHRNELGHYYRYLYNIFRFIDNSRRDDRIQYAKFIRAQLSDYELIVLFFNAHTNRGVSFVRYIKIYDLMDNTPHEIVDNDIFAKAIIDRAKSRASEKAKAKASPIPPRK